MMFGNVLSDSRGSGFYDVPSLSTFKAVVNKFGNFFETGFKLCKPLFLGCSLVECQD